MKTIKDLLIEELRDTYSSETQVLRGLSEMAQAATSPNLRHAFEVHQGETKAHVDRLVQAFERLAASPEGNSCEATEGLLIEAREVVAEGLPGELLDVALVMAARKVVHYEIASYAALAAIATGCGETEVAALLDKTLADEKTADERLTHLAQTEINKRAFASLGTS